MLEFFGNFGEDNFTLAPQNVNFIQIFEKYFSVFRQNGGQNYFWFRFSVQYRLLHPRLGTAQNLKNF